MPGPEFTVRPNFGPAIDATRDLLGRQLPYALRVALNKTAELAKQRLVSEMAQRFDRATPYTLNSIRISYASKDRLEAKVWVKDEAGKGTPAERYLGPEVIGGQRRQKRYERSLQAAGVLPSGMYTVTGRAAQLDAFGNLSRGQIVQLLSYFRAFGEQGYRANMTDKRRANLLKGKPSQGVRGFSYFALARQEGKLPPGIYQRVAYSTAESGRIAHLQRGGAKPVLLFVRHAAYRPIFPFFDLVRETVEGSLAANFEASTRHALATARA
ncbi:hypothetical protein K2O51_23400 [Cupriavidus pinatubonensis]|uniref:hypothetical protein n=1 Tax=Cupriavidus pinatubonensis TaxID=248026 RepID=UPI001C738888|nr:hypothetical protein [Cupriavidus pinatubonensis]QYY30319.1 hypothetical protein K2O51_23400 [Cupriavidus pinatubonensis]